MKLKAENVNEAKGRRRNRNEIAIESRKWKMHSHEQ